MKLKRLLLTACVTLLAVASAHAHPRRPLIRRANVSPSPARVVPFAVPLPPPLVLPGLPAEPQRIPPPAVGEVTLPQRPVVQAVGRAVTAALDVPAVAVGQVGTLAQRHAEAQARAGVMHHSGQFSPGSSREGVGFSTVSPQHAVQSSCYWGRCQPTQIGVSGGPGAWYATVQYK